MVSPNQHRGGTVRRLVGLLTYLKDARLPLRLPALAVRFSCSTRTIRRDLEAIEDSGVSVPRWRVR